MPYPQNFVVRLIICIIGMTALWLLADFIMTVVVNHEAFAIRPTQLIIPIVLGVVEAFVWKPKENK